MEKTCDRIGFLKAGELVKTGTLSELLTPGAERELETTGFKPELLKRIKSALGKDFLKSEGNRISFRATDQSVTDKVIDMVRAGGVGIKSLEPNKTDLEEWYMNLINN